MRDFNSLQKLLNMDFTQLRALPAAGGCRASDEAIAEFVNCLNSFFSQFDHQMIPTGQEIATYATYITNLTAKINESERAYYVEKYRKEQYPEQTVQYMADTCQIKSFRDLPKRMQFWAAAEKHGDSIRNPDNHKTAVTNLNRWAKFVDGMNTRHTLFQPQKFATTPSSEYPAKTI